MVNSSEADKVGSDAKKKGEVTVILNTPATPATDACLLMRIEEDAGQRGQTCHDVPFCARSAVAASESAVVHTSLPCT